MLNDQLHKKYKTKKKKRNGRLNICDHIPKQNLFEKTLVFIM